MVYNMLMIPEIHTVCIIIWHREGHKGMEGGRGWNINLLAQRLHRLSMLYAIFFGRSILRKCFISKGERQNPDGKCKSESESEKCTVYSQQDASEITVSAPYSPFYTLT